MREIPEYKRPLADQAIQRVIKRFYGDSDEKIQSIVSVVLDALERDEYWEVLQAIHRAEHGDVQKFADALTEFGFLEIILIAKQATRRIEVLDALDLLISKDETLEKQVHKVFETNPWILGVEHTLLFSNTTTQRVVEEYTKEKYEGDNAAKRPDLLLLSDLHGHFTLIEFKRPSKTIDRDDETQAQKYRDDLSAKFAQIRIVLIGKDVDQSLRMRPGSEIQYFSYSAICARAKAEVQWILKSLSK